MALGYTLKNYVIGERILRGLPNSRPNREESEFAQAGERILRGLPNSRPNREELEFAQAGVGKNGIR